MSCACIQTRTHARKHAAKESGAWQHAFSNCVLLKSHERWWYATVRRDSCAQPKTGRQARHVYAEPRAPVGEPRALCCTRGRLQSLLAYRAKRAQKGAQRTPPVQRRTLPGTTIATDGWMHARRWHSQRAVRL